MSKQEILKVTTHLAHVTILLCESICRFHCIHGIDFGFKNLHEGIKMWLLEVVF